MKNKSSTSLLDDWVIVNVVDDRHVDASRRYQAINVVDIPVAPRTRSHDTTSTSVGRFNVKNKRNESDASSTKNLQKEDTPSDAEPDVTDTEVVDNGSEMNSQSEFVRVADNEQQGDKELAVDDVDSDNVDEFFNQEVGKTYIKYSCFSQAKTEGDSIRYPRAESECSTNRDDLDNDGESGGDDNESRQEFSDDKDNDGEDNHGNDDEDDNVNDDEDDNVQEDEDDNVQEEEDDNVQEDEYDNIQEDEDGNAQEDEDDYVQEDEDDTLHEYEDDNVIENEDDNDVPGYIEDEEKDTSAFAKINKDTSDDDDNSDENSELENSPDVPSERTSDSALYHADRDSDESGYRRGARARSKSARVNGEISEQERRKVLRDITFLNMIRSKIPRLVIEDRRIRGDARESALDVPAVNNEADDVDGDGSTSVESEASANRSTRFDVTPGNVFTDGYENRGSVATRIGTRTSSGRRNPQAKEDQEVRTAHAPRQLERVLENREPCQRYYPLVAADNGRQIVFLDLCYFLTIPKERCLLGRK